MAMRRMEIIFVVVAFTTSQVLCSTNSANEVLNDNDATATTTLGPAPPTPPHQLNCSADPHTCNVICGEAKSLQYSSTFCNPATGSCVCDCRDRLKKECVQTPFTPCFQDCVKQNPNPDAFLYEGGNCPISLKNSSVISYQCACECTVREDYDETNDIF